MTGSSGTAPSPFKGILTTSPFYLHPSESLGVKITSCIFNGENYDTWASQVRNGLKAKNKLRFIDGTVTKPVIQTDGKTSEEAIIWKTAWDTCNSMIISWLFNVIDEKIHPSISYSETAKDLWDDLKERYSAGNAPRVYQLRSELSQLKQGNMSLVEYYNKLKGKWDELGKYTFIPTYNCGAATEFSRQKEEEKLYQFLMGLNTSSYGALRSNILVMEPLPSIGNAYSLVMREESHKTVTRGQEDRSESSVFAVKIQGTSSKIWQQEEATERPKCTHCGKLGHDVSDCFQINGYPPNWGRGAGRGRGQREGFGGRGV